MLKFDTPVHWNGPRLVAIITAIVALTVFTRAAESDEKENAPKPAPSYRTVMVTGLVPERLSVFTDVMVKLVAEYDVPGASLAIAKDDQVIFSQGYGFAHRENKSPVFPTTRFRIASLSKPLTAVAILRLVQAGRLRLDERLIDVLPLPPFVDGRISEVRIHHLLQHHAGWDRSVSYDPMFRSVEMAQALKKPAPASARDIILYMTCEPLDHDPGSHYAYSNFGYNLLGRVIEERTGQSYESFVRSEILEPLGILEMEIGSTRKTKFHESKYYSTGTGPSVFADNLGEQVPHPYGAWHLEAMDSHGAWIASAEDLAKFSAALEDAPGRLLDKAHLAKMAALDSNKPENLPSDWHYGLGWSIRPQGDSYQRSHTGSLPGTSTLMARRPDGVHWVVLFNRRDTKDKRRLSSVALERLEKAAAALGEF